MCSARRQQLPVATTRFDRRRPNNYNSARVIVGRNRPEKGVQTSRRCRGAVTKGCVRVPYWCTDTHTHIPSLQQTRTSRRRAAYGGLGEGTQHVSPRSAGPSRVVDLVSVRYNMCINVLYLPPLLQRQPQPPPSPPPPGKARAL